MQYKLLEMVLELIRRSKEVREIGEKETPKQKPLSKTPIKYALPAAAEALASIEIASQ